MGSARLQRVYQWVRDESPPELKPYVDLIIDASTSTTLQAPAENLQARPDLTGAVLHMIKYEDGSGESEHMLLPIKAPSSSHEPAAYNRILMRRIMRKRTQCVCARAPGRIATA